MSYSLCGSLRQAAIRTATYKPSPISINRHPSAYQGGAPNINTPAASTQKRASRAKAPEEPDPQHVENRHAREGERKHYALTGDAPTGKQRHPQHQNKDTRGKRRHAAGIEKDCPGLPGWNEVEAQPRHHRGDGQGQPFAKGFVLPQAGSDGTVQTTRKTRWWGWPTKQGRRQWRASATL